MRDRDREAVDKDMPEVREVTTSTERCTTTEDGRVILNHVKENKEQKQ